MIILLRLQVVTKMTAFIVQELATFSHAKCFRDGNVGQNIVRIQTFMFPAGWTVIYDHTSHQLEDGTWTW